MIWATTSYVPLRAGAHRLTPIIVRLQGYRFQIWHTRGRRRADIAAQEAQHEAHGPYQNTWPDKL